MKTFVVAMAGLCLAAGPAAAQIDYANPTVETIVTRQQILDYTGAQAENPATGIALRGLVLNSQGNFVFSDRGGAQDQARLLEVDLSGAQPVFRTLATEAELAALLQTSVAPDQPPGALPRLNFNGLTHAAIDGTDYYYLSNFGELPNGCTTCADELFEIAVAGAGAPALRRVGSKDGIVALSLLDGDLYFSLHAPFSRQEDYDGIWRMNIATGESELLHDYFDFLTFLETIPDSTRAPGGMGLNGASMGIDPDGKFRFFSDANGANGGPDDFYILDPATFVADPRQPAELDILIPFTDWQPGGQYENPQGIPGFTGFTMDTNNTMYIFDQFPQTGTRRLVVIEDDGAIHYVELAPLLGITSGQVFFPNNSFQVVVESESKIVLYGLLADGAAGAGNPRIVKFTFTDPNATEPVLLGDINGDGIINVADVTALASLVKNGPLPSLEIGDVNDDGAVDELDVAALALQIVND